MHAQLTLVAPAATPLSQHQIDLAMKALETAGAAADQPVELHKDIAVDIGFTTEVPDFKPDLGGIGPIDFAITPAEGRRKKILVADMDSTMIEIETLDTLATALGFGDVVAEITAKAMQGNLDFAEGLRVRVKMLKGFNAADSFQLIIDEVTYSPGGKQAVLTMKKHGAHCALVSGGFTATTEIVHAHLGFDEHHANTLLIDDEGLFTGFVQEPILDRDSKLTILMALCAERGLDLTQTCTIGDGANDLAMLQSGGLGIGYYGKPRVREKAPCLIDHTDMTSLLYYQGYHRDEFVETDIQ